MDSTNILEWRNVSVWGPKKTRRLKQIFTGKDAYAPLILNNVSGSVKSGLFVAVMGPSGSGKTSLLAQLSGRSRHRSVGSVFLNGATRSESTCAIVPQKDIFIDSLTVSEHLFFMAELKLHDQMSMSDKTKRLNILVDDLKLQKHKSTQIRYLSGGEKKAVTLASMLINEPPVIFCDEPTTGMDSYSTLLVVNLLKELAKNGKIVMCSIHQPTSQIFQNFDEIILVADGQIVFQGTQNYCLSFFESVGFRCPTSYNPSEYYLQKISRKENVQTLALTFEMTRKHDTFAGRSDETSKKSIDMKKAPWMSQLILLTWRFWLDFRRNIKDYFFETFLSIVKALMIATIFNGVSGTSQQGIQDMRGLHFMMAFEVSYNAEYTILLAFHRDLTIFKREHTNYSASAFYIAKLLVMVPKLVLNPIILMIILSPVVQFPHPGPTFLINVGTLILLSITGASFGLMLSALFTASGFAQQIVTPLDLIMSSCGGVYFSLKSLPLWMQVLKNISHFFYSMSALSKITWAQIGDIPCYEDPTLPCLNSGLSVLESLGYYHTPLIYDYLGLLALITGTGIIGIISLSIQGKYGSVAY